MHIAIAGNIGAGKTSLTELLAKHYAWEAHFEDVYVSSVVHEVLAGAVIVEALDRVIPRDVFAASQAHRPGVRQHPHF